MSLPNQLSILPPQDADKWKPVRDDFNFCRLALFVSSDKKADRFRDIEQHYSVDLHGKQFTAIWEVRHDPKLGLPGSFDRDVWLGIMELVSELSEGQRKPIPQRIEIKSHRDFLRRIGKPHSGNYQKLLKESIRRLTVTMCLTDRSFNCPSSGGYLQLVKPIHLIDGCAFKGDVDTKGNVIESTWIELGEYVRRNLENGYIALLDVAYIRSLKGEIAKQLYPLLSYRFWLASQRGRDFTVLEWRELSEYLGSNWPNAVRARQRLKDALQELIAREYIDSTSEWQGDQLVFRIGNKFIDEMRTRLNAREAFNAWSQAKGTAKQLSILPAQSSRPWNVSRDNQSPEDEREIILIRQATRLALFQQSPDATVLEKHGWCVDDVISLAKTLKRPLE